MYCLLLVSMYLLLLVSMYLPVSMYLLLLVSMYLLLTLLYALPSSELAKHADMALSMQLCGGTLLATTAK